MNESTFLFLYNEYISAIKNVVKNKRAMANKNRSPEKPIYEFLIQKGKEACVK
jgi:hypothetical protein